MVNEGLTKNTTHLQVVVLICKIGSFRFDYEYEIEYEYDLKFAWFR